MIGQLEAVGSFGAERHCMPLIPLSALSYLSVTYGRLYASFPCIEGTFTVYEQYLQQSMKAKDLMERNVVVFRNILQIQFFFVKYSHSVPNGKAFLLFLCNPPRLSTVLFR